MTVLQQMRTYTLTPGKFPYCLGSKGKGSFADLLKKVNGGNVNLIQSPFRMSLIWHIMTSKDSLFEGVLEWLELLIPLVNPLNLNAEQKIFFDLVKGSQPNMVNGYKKLNEQLHVLTEIKKKEASKVSEHKLNNIMLLLIQHFPLKDLGEYLEERKQKLPNLAYPDDFPALFRKAKKLASNFPFKGRPTAPIGNKLGSGNKRSASDAELIQYAIKKKKAQRDKNKRKRFRQKTSKGKGSGDGT